MVKQSRSRLSSLFLSYLAVVCIQFFFSTGFVLGQVHDVITGQVSLRDALAVAMPPEPQGIDRDFFITLRGDLQRSSVFSIVDFTGESPANPELAGAHLVPAGANYLVLFRLKEMPESGNVQVEGYLCSASSGVPVFGRRYEVGSKELDICAHHLSDDIVHHVTGVKGFAAYRIAFTANYKGQPSVYSVYPDGSRLKRLASGPFLCLFPRYSPARNWIIYTAYKRGFPELYILDVNSGRNMAIPPKAGLNSFGAISPDGSAIAATMSFSGNPEIYLLSLTGKITRKFTENRGCDLSPCWSPDGKNIAWVSDTSGAPHIYIKPVEGEQAAKRVTWPFNSGDYCVSPDWSSDGKSIVFSARKNGNFDVYTIDAESLEVKRITNTSANEEAVSWAADNRHVVASSKENGKNQLVIIDTVIEGDISPVNISGVVNKVRNPTWSSVSH